MNTDKLSRRRLLGGFLAGLTAWLCPRPPRVAAAPPPPPPLPVPPHGPFGHVVMYSYDAQTQRLDQR